MKGTKTDITPASELYFAQASGKQARIYFFLERPGPTRWVGTDDGSLQHCYD